MSSTAAPPKKEKLSRPAPKFVVLMGDEHGGAPDAEKEIDYLIPIRIERSAGGGRVDCATLAYDLANRQERVLDTLAPKGVNRQCEIRELDDEGKVKRVLFWGKLSAEPIQLDKDTESVTFVVRLDRHLFGGPTQQTPFWDDLAPDKFILLDRPMIFNPTLDERVQGNRSDREDPDRDDSFCFFAVGGPDTDAARTTQSQTPTRWFLYQAVHTMCWLLNQDETFIQNPSRDELFTILKTVDPDGDRLRNFSVAKGQFLPDVLDSLLTPFGAGWYIEYLYDENNTRSKRVLKFFVRSQGTRRELFLQRPGERLVTTKTNTPSLAMKFDVANMANVIIGKSSLKQREVTIELQKGWPVSEDSYDRETLNANGRLDHPHAGRKWPANENGAWTGLRPEITGAISFANEFGEPTLITSRKCLPCLSRFADQQTNALESRGVYAEWFNPDSNEWEPLPWTYSKLEQELGIFISKVEGPLWDLIQEDPASARIRVTCTIEGDSCNTVKVNRNDESPNGDEIPLVLDLSDKFHDRTVVVSGPFQSRFSGEVATADIQNDQAEMLKYLQKLQENEDAADLACSASLEGIDHPEWEISNLVTSVNGRNLKLNRNSPKAGVSPKYLQVMGMTLDVQSNRQELNLESFDEEQS